MDITRFAVGQPIVLRGLHQDGRISAVECGRVIRDDERGVLAWIGRGSAVVRRTTLDGSPTRYLPLAAKLEVPLLHAVDRWRGPGVLILKPDGAAHSIWWFFAENGEFDGWYINLEQPAGRWWGGVDCRDQALDVIVRPDRRWQWKDEDEFAERTGHRLYWDEAGAARIRAEGERLIGLAVAGRYPFDGTWCDFRPDPDWAPTELPWWWDQLRPSPSAAR